ncbi:MULTISPECIES: peptidoglycan editing factor PgeF [Gracilibacillus]|uniref:peptidoglycan editing factor PgeF n=1 Tax=Gracilibacillus TaxID=74385 RepID=UPI0008248DA9|nr:MULTISPECIES: peptidoglycan editing factor PgeF [Gracilibacillus]
MEPFILSSDQSFLTIQPWQNDPQIIAGFTTRYHGVSQEPYYSQNMGYHVGDESSDVLTNRTLLANKIGVNLEDWVAAEQVHDNQIKEAVTNDRGKGVFTLEDAIQGTDGLFTKQPRLLCTALFADCVPVFFADRQKGMVALAHAGWKGTAANIVGEMTTRFQAESSELNDIEVVIGPSIGPTCYQVDDRVIQHVASEYTQIYEGDNGQYQIDLKEWNRLLAIDAGIPPSQIWKTSYCTAQNPLFFSHREEGHPTGRMMGYIGLR